MRIPSPWRRSQGAAVGAALVLGGCAPRLSVPVGFDHSVRRGPFVAERVLQPLDTLPVGDHPKSVYFSPNGRAAFVCNLEQGSVDILDPVTGARTQRLVFHRTPTIVSIDGKPTPSFEEKPVEIGFTAGGRFVWISLLNAGGVVVFDRQGRLTPPVGAGRTVDVYEGRRRIDIRSLLFIPTGRQPKIVAPTPDGRRVFVANWMGASISVIDAVRFQRIKNVPVGWLPRGICFVGNRAYVANFGSRSIAEIDLTSLKRTRIFPNIGRNPRHLVAAPDGRTFYVSCHGDGTVLQIDAATGLILRTCPVGREPRSLALSSRRNFLFVVNYKDNTVSALDLGTFQAVATAPTLDRPVGVSVDRRSDTVWVSDYRSRALSRYRFECLLRDRDDPRSRRGFRTAAAP